MHCVVCLIFMTLVKMMIVVRTLEKSILQGKVGEMMSKTAWQCTNDKSESGSGVEEDREAFGKGDSRVTSTGHIRTSCLL